MKDTINKLAKSMADSLFTNGHGDKADRLVLELRDGSNGGGWSYPAVVAVIASYLKSMAEAEHKK